MAAGLVGHRPNAGTMSSGGTESIFLAVHTVARDHGRAEPGHRRAATRHRRAPSIRRSPRRATTSTSSTSGCRSAPTAGRPEAMADAARRPHRSSSSARRRATRTASSTRSPSSPASRPTRGIALPRRRLPRRLAPAVLGAPRRAGAAVGLPGRRASPRCPPTSTSTATPSRARRSILYRDRELRAAPVLPVRRLARRPLRLGHRRRHPPGGARSPARGRPLNHLGAGRLPAPGRDRSATPPDRFARRHRRHRRAARSPSDPDLSRVRVRVRRPRRSTSAASAT